MTVYIYMFSDYFKDNDTFFQIVAAYQIYLMVPLTMLTRLLDKSLFTAVITGSNSFLRKIPVGENVCPTVIGQVRNLIAFQVIIIPTPRLYYTILFNVSTFGHVKIAFKPYIWVGLN